MKRVDADSLLRLAPYVWLLYFPALFAAPALNHSGEGVWIPTAAAAVIFIPLYAYGHTAQRMRDRYAIVTMIAILGFALLPINPSAAVFVVYASGISGMIPPLGRGLAVAVALATAVCVEGAWAQLHARLWAWAAFFTLASAVVNACLATMWKTRLQLREAREQIAGLAVAAERARIARDLHDILGHTLSLITLKASLASRIASSEPEQAIREIREVELISREALGQVRTAVEGFRDGDLASELAGAARILEAAGVMLQTDIAALPLGRQDETVLAAVVREAVTNIVRHAGATICHITLSTTDGDRILEIRDDGRGISGREGHGLTGIRERAGTRGGSVAITTSQGTSIRVTLPRKPRAGLPSGGASCAMGAGA